MFKIIRFFICIGLCHISITQLETKNIFKKFIDLNPIKQAIKTTTGADPVLPTNIFDVKTDVIDNFHVVEEGALYRSAQLSAKSLDAYMKEYNIKTVINLRGAHPEEDWWLKETEVVLNNGGTLFNVPTFASKLTSKNKIRKILEIFDTAPRPILVHCLAGIDRTGEVAALWLLDQQHKTNAQALAQLSIWNKHIAYPAKDFLIKIWQGRTWLEQEYNPLNYTQFQADIDETNLKESGTATEN